MARIFNPNPSRGIMPSPAGGITPSLPSPVGGTGTGQAAGIPGVLPAETPPASVPTGPANLPILEPGYGPRTNDSLDSYNTYKAGRMSRLLQGRLPFR